MSPFPDLRLFLWNTSISSYDSPGQLSVGQSFAWCAHLVSLSMILISGSSWWHLWHLGAFIFVSFLISHYLVYIYIVPPTNSMESIASLRNLRYMLWFTICVLNCMSFRERANGFSFFSVYGTVCLYQRELHALHGLIETDQALT